MFLELLLIRWISSEIRIFAYFKNFVLIACFLGFGLGCHLSRLPINLTVMLFPLLVLAAICELPVASLRNYVDSITPLVGGISGVDIWGVPSLPLNSHTLLVVPAALLFVVPMFGLIALVFVPIGQLVGWYLENATNGITAYTVNVLGSLAGIVLYTGLCFLSQPPAILVPARGRNAGLAVLETALAALDVGRRVSALRGDLGVRNGRGPACTGRPIRNSRSGPCATVARSCHTSSRPTGAGTSRSWISGRSLRPLTPSGSPTPRSSGTRTTCRITSILLRRRCWYWGRAPEMTSAAALRNGAGRVVAVEIDPLILDLGRQLHFEKPYDSPRAHVVVDDARSYVQNSSDRFDLIVFSLLDSHTTSSYYSNIRIDNYVYTLEALRATRKLLKPDGLMIIKFQVNTPWIAGRLARWCRRCSARRRCRCEVTRPSAAPPRAVERCYIAGSKPGSRRRSSTRGSPNMSASTTTLRPRRPR